MLTPRDFKAQERIFHRSLFLRAFNPEAPSSQCRCCGAAEERFSHLYKCEKIREVFDFFVTFAGAFDNNIQMRAITLCLGLITPERVLPGGLSALHVILWKFVLIAFTRVDTDGAKFEPVNVWLQAVRRFRRNVQAKGEAERRRHLEAAGLGKAPPTTENAGRKGRISASFWGQIQIRFERNKRICFYYN